MSRRKQRNPRQIKRSLGEMEETDESLALELTTSDKDGSVSDLEDLADCDSSSPSYSDAAEAEGEPSSSVPQVSDQEMGEAEPTANLLEEATPPGDSEGESAEAEESENYKESEGGDSTEDATQPRPWNGPDELVVEHPSPGGVSQVRAQTELPKGLTWGPYRGTFTGSASSPDRSEVGGALSLEVDEDCWLKNVTLVPCEFEANSVLYRKGDQIWCKTSQVIEQGEVVRAFLMAEPQAIPNFSVKEEPGESSQEITTQPEFQLLPQQAGMAAILATAVVNKDIFPCKDCGIWYRSERNLQAHLMYYCASRQSSTSPTMEEKPKDSYPNERVCPFPQCKKSCPSASSLEIHMRSHSGERPFVCLICLSAFTTKANCERHLKVHTDTLNGVCHGCGFISTTRDILYSHLVTNHMICQPGAKVDVYPAVKTLPAIKPSNSGITQIANLLKCSLCGFSADSLASLQQHAIMHAAASLPGASQSISRSPRSDAEKEQPPDSLKNGDAKSPGSSSSSSGMEDPPLKVHIKEEPDELRPVSEAVSGSPKARDESALVPSPAVKVKTEISSPTPGSSPVPNESGAAAGGGTIIVPQYMFGHEAAPAIVPQASEILAKMSELVHNRLKQGQAVASVGFSGTPTPKGATCYECEITFNNINNYYVHKKLYCSGRHLSDDNPGSGRKVKVHPVRAAAAPAISVAEEQRASPQQEDASGESSTLTVKIKVEEGTGAENEASGSGHVSEGSQSPGPLEDAEGNPTRTVCDACNIHFSRHETYMVHKRYYCASRHDPPLRRSGVINKPGPLYTPQPPPRTRKRRKLYEIHGISPADLTPPALLPLTRVEALPLIPGLIAAPSVPSPSSSPDAEDGPIDLSKKPRLTVESPLPLPLPAAAAAVVPLTDYHECTACQISFHSLESYLAHKKFSCPVAPLQQKALQQLQKIKSPLNASGKIGEEGVRIKVERRTTLSPGSMSDSIQPVAIPYTAIPDTKPLQQYTTGSVEASPSTTTTCPYCPTNVVIRGDLLEHFRSVHGLLLAKPTPGHRLQTTFMEVLLPARVQPSSSSENSLPSPPASSTSPLQGQGLPRDITNSKDTASSSSSNGSPVSSATPRPVLTSISRPLLPSSPALPLNPLAETRLPAHALLPGDKPMQPPKASLSSALPNGNHRYCRLCNIKFSSLSTFIAHKKYYCSSHAAEHVK
ncbi:PREDICTED: zinc finger protein ZFPM1 [Nanorana parkeri]|uniref:zinc finger protein ZFPM1 n=1 Tax=Nanorana parkeri TaxID=125878 RepID=UPI000854E508|nr:PREDICTED: zinc finger protein ZFPM1 [Nanorana parkeri]